MAKRETKRISITALEGVANKTPATKEVKWNDLTITIKPTLSLEEMMMFCDDISSMCFSESGDFMPELSEFMIRMGVLTYYANFTFPANITRAYQLVYGTNAYDIVFDYVNKDQFTGILDAAKAKVKYLCDSDVLAFRNKCDELVNVMSSSQEQIVDMFGDITPEEAQALFNAVEGDGKFNEEKLVDAYVKSIKKDNIIDFEAAKASDD